MWFVQVLRKLLAFHDGPAIFAGDTNLREPEVKQEKMVKQVNLKMNGNLDVFTGSPSQNLVVNHALFIATTAGTYFFLANVIMPKHDCINLRVVCRSSAFNLEIEIFKVVHQMRLDT